MQQNQKMVRRVLIGIQARSTSKRFPNKAMAMIGDKTITEHVLTNVEEAVSFLRRSMTDPLEITTALLIPDGDPLKKYGDRCQIIEGDEYDVLSRYQKAVAYCRPDYIVRVTGDCPLLPDYIISKHIRSALYGNLDYCDNRWIGTAPDGHDVEVISRRLFRWISENAIKPYDREHVTTIARCDMPTWARVGHIIGHQDQHKVKLSVDTVEDLERVREQYASIEAKLEKARTHHPITVIYRL